MAGLNDGADRSTVGHAWRAVDREDVAVALGIGLVTVGMALAWFPLGPIVLGVAILAVVRYGSSEV